MVAGYGNASYFRVGSRNTVWGFKGSFRHWSAGQVHNRSDVVERHSVGRAPPEL